jgi:hypothetical protein
MAAGSSPPATPFASFALLIPVGVSEKTEVGVVVSLPGKVVEVSAAGWDVAVVVSGDFEVELVTGAGTDISNGGLYSYVPVKSSII